MTTLNSRLPPRTPFHVKLNPIPSSSPAFATPVHPIRPAHDANKPSNLILPILLPPATLRPIAFRTFTKKHNLTLTSSALQALANFVGKHCGSGWRGEGLAEMVLEEVARMWKRGDGRVIVDGEGNTLKDLLKQLEGSMSGGKIIIGKAGRTLSRQASMIASDNGSGLQRQDSFGISNLDIEDEEESEEKDPRSWLKVVNAYEQPRMVYNASKKHFEKSKATPTFFPSPTQKTQLFRQRYHLIHQRVLRNESFQKSSIANQAGQEWKITPISNLLGRSGTSHLLLGLLTIAPTGTLAINDLTGSISLDLDQASSIDSIETWLCPGMIVLVDGVYEEEFNSAGGNLGNMGGIGGTIGGRFIGLSIGAPRCETRAATLGLSDAGQELGNIGGGFGWVDFLGVGSERAVGSRMRKIEQRLLGYHNNPDIQPEKTNSNKIVILGEVNLDNPKTLTALRKVLLTYTQPSERTLEQSPPPPPLAFILLGNFVSNAAMSSTTTSTSTTQNTAIPDSISYKEYFDALALLLSDFSHLLRHTTWIFVPGDNDPWPSSFSAGAAVPLPRGGVPDLFTSRIKRVFATANSDNNTVAGGGKDVKKPGEAVWTTNPSRVSLFGPSQELVLFRDDVSSRLRRNAVSLKKGNDHTGDLNVDAETDIEVDITSTTTHDISSSSAAAAAANGPPAEATAMEIDHTGSSTETQTQPPHEGPTLPQPQQPPTQSTPRARALTKTLLDQSHLSPFPLTLRPQHWSHAHSLSLYPLPSVLVLCDAEQEAFVCGYQGCCVLNAGRLVGGTRGGDEGGGSGSGRGGKDRASWVEYDVLARKGVVRGI